MLNTETGKDDEAGEISQQDGRNHPVESMGRNDQTVLSEGRAWTICSGYRDDAADVSDADMVQPVRRRDRGRHIGQLRHA